ncbi:MAG: CCA tRNA nucleotidyltransferase, partial [Rhodobiaceae bacterium]|nr:CCA tRNA nucleotidyltransferase [Rhodobiaceae bacterium]
MRTLAGQAWFDDPAVGAIYDLLDGAEGKARIVGGAVRNALIGMPVADIDFATVHRPESVMKRARKAGFKAIPTGIEHGTITIVAEGRPFEVTSLRRDVETDGRRAVVAFTEDWAE